MKVLVIGSKGFIGAHLLSYLLSNKIQCWGCDVYTDYNEERFFLLDASNADFNEVFSCQQFDVCINCSGAASVQDSLLHPLRDFTLNTLNVIKILDAMRRYSTNCKFVNLSSAAVYGNPQKLPIVENNSIDPVSPYGFHKQYAENICKEYHRFFSLQTCSVRIFSAYGAGLKKQLFWDLFSKTKTDKPIALFGTGKETRDFIYITDIVNALWLVIQQASFKGDVYNVANGEEVTIETAANLFYKILSNKIVFSFNGEVREGDPQNWVADITKIKQLGYKPAVSINEGIENYIEWLKEEKLV
jgi:dTDP-glucose 4,6-dehydratase/UDP-glucose 4-epimerase